MNIYIDESGDLGWSFSQPYGNGGSSRYLTIAFLLTKNDSHKYTKRVIRNLRNKFDLSPNTEIKGIYCSSKQEEYFISKTIDALQKFPDIQIACITVRKTNVQEHIRQDSNKLYNYMIKLAIINKILDQNVVTLIPDPRTIKVADGNSLYNYLQINLWFEQNVNTTIKWESCSSENSLNLQFIDIVSHVVWRHYEKNISENFNKLRPFIENKELFF